MCVFFVVVIKTISKIRLWRADPSVSSMVCDGLHLSDGHVPTLTGIRPAPSARFKHLPELVFVRIVGAEEEVVGAG